MRTAAKFLIRVKATGQYLNPRFRKEPEIVGSRDNLDLLPIETARKLASDLYGTDWEKRVEVLEASASEWFRYIGRRGGAAATEKKVAASQRNGLLGGRPRKHQEEII